MTSKNEILDYVANTPGNTNRAVLSSLIDNLDSGQESGSTVTMPVYGIPQGEGQTPSFLTSYSGAPGIIMEVIVPGSEEIRFVSACDINNILASTEIPFLDNGPSASIPTLDPATIDPSYNAVLISFRGIE